jgi:nucleosome binding factor SPN SPT16 subunit
MSEEVAIDSATFRKRVQKLQRKIREGDALFNGAPSVVIIIGKSDEENPYVKSSVLHVCNLLLSYDRNIGLLTFLDLAFRLRIPIHCVGHHRQ